MNEGRTSDGEGNANSGNDTVASEERPPSGVGSFCRCRTVVACAALVLLVLFWAVTTPSIRRISPRPPSAAAVNLGDDEGPPPSDEELRTATGGDEDKSGIREPLQPPLRLVVGEEHPYDDVDRTDGRLPDGSRVDHADDGSGEGKANESSNEGRRHEAPRSSSSNRHRRGRAPPLIDLPVTPARTVPPPLMGGGAGGGDDEAGSHLNVRRGDHRRFAFAAMPSFELPSPDKVDSERVGAAAQRCVCTNASCFDPDHVSECIRQYGKVVDRRTPTELADALLIRARRVATAWRRLGGIRVVDLQRATLHRRAVALFIEPPRVTPIPRQANDCHADKGSSCLELSTTDITRVVQSPLFASLWRSLLGSMRRRPSGTSWAPSSAAEEGRRRSNHSDEVDHIESTGDDTTREGSIAKKAWGAQEAPPQAAAISSSLPPKGFLLVVHISDYTNESAPIFNIYSMHDRRSRAFLMWDPYMARIEATGLLGPYITTRYDAVARNVFRGETNASLARCLEQPSACRGRPQEPFAAASKSAQSGDRPPLTEWAARKPQLYFRGSKTRAIRAKIQDMLKDGEVADVSVKWSYGRKQKMQPQPFEDAFGYKAVLAMRGQTAALRDRMLLLTGAAMVRVVSVVDEPCQLAHGLLHPYVHFLPLAHAQPPFAKLASRHVEHLKPLPRVLKRVFGEHDDFLARIADNNLRLGRIVASLAFRDYVLAHTIAAYAAVLLDAPLLHQGGRDLLAQEGGADAMMPSSSSNPMPWDPHIPTTLEGAIRVVRSAG